MKLAVLNGPMKGRVHSLRGGDVSLGRKQDADLCLLTDPQISRKHCRLRLEDGGYVLEDLGSANGTWLNGKRVETSEPLAPGDVFRLGHTHVGLLEDDADAETFIRNLEEAPETHPSSPATIQVLFEEGENRPVNVMGVLDPRALLDMPTETGDVAALERLRKRLKVVQDVAEALAGKGTSRKILEAVLDSIMQVVPAERAFALLPEAEGGDGDLMPVAVRTREGSPQTEITISRTIVDRALSEGVSLLIHDALSDEQLRSRHSIAISSIRSAMCVPILRQKSVQALIHLDATLARAFDEEDLELVTAMANQASVVLDNTRLYDELQRAYEELKAAHQQMVESEKLSIIGTLAASIAHDIGNVLTPIQGVSKLILRSQDLDPRMKESFERQMQRLKALTQQLLSFSRPRPPKLVPSDLNHAVQDSMDLVRTEARHKGVEIFADLAEGLPKVNADVNHLDQVFINLMLNAVQAMEGGGTLTVSTRAEGGYAVVSFHDTGPGIPAENLDRIFAPFFTTKKETGTGMGLFSCRRIVEEEHGGRLQVHNAEDGGAVFDVRIPVP